MKILIALLMFFSLAASAEEQTQKEQFIPLECYPINPFLDRFKEYFGEDLVFMSGSVNYLEEELFHQLWINQDTQTWTFMVSNEPRQTICVIASGKGYNNWGPSI